MQPPRPAIRPDDDPVATALHHLDRAVSAGSAERITRNLERRQARRRNRRLALGTALASLVMVGLSLRFGGGASAELAPVSRPLSVAVIAPQTQTLPDGSTVDLKPGARLEVAFTPALRRVTLQSGEAHFSVQKDPARPFVVTAGAVEVRAVGTAFSVDLATGAVAVFVTEGRVAVSPPPPLSANSRGRPAVSELAAGQRAVLPRDQRAAAPPEIATVPPAEAADLLAWRVPRLEFSGTPLAEAIPLFNRYAGTRLKLDPRLGGLRLSGTLRSDDREALELLLRDEFGIATLPQADGSVLLRHH